MSVRRSSAGLLLFLSAFAWAGACVRAEDAARRAIAEQFAPIIYQETRSFKLDQITSFDFDGDWNGANNWENAYLYPTPAYVYYAVIEADRHYFLYYAFFHARDYTAIPAEGFAPKIEHENDMEGLLLVVEKAPLGRRLIYMETLAHDHFYKYVAGGADDILARVGQMDGSITLDNSHPASTGRPRACVFVESQGHGVFDLRSKYRGESDNFPGIIYRPSGRGAEEPRYGEDHNVSYALVPLQETLWTRRAEIGSTQTYCCAERYELSGQRQARFGASFNGPIGGCAAKPPWGWDDAKDGDVKIGDWFLNPIRAIATHVGIPGFSRRYVYNPYLQGSALNSPAVECRQSSESQTLRQSALKTALGIGQVLLSGGADRKSIGQQARNLFLKDLTLLEWSRQSEMTRWEFLDQSSKPLGETGKFTGDTYQTRLQISGATTLNSPIFSAPQRFFRTVVMRYRLDSPLKLTLHWQNDDQTSMPEEQKSQSLQLPAAGEWSVFKIDLSEHPAWKAGLTAMKLQLVIEPLDAVAPVVHPPMARDLSTGHAAANLEIQYLVFDRTALADTFRQQ